MKVLGEVPPPLPRIIHFSWQALNGVMSAHINYLSSAHFNLNKTSLVITYTSAETRIREKQMNFKIYTFDKVGSCDVYNLQLLIT